MYITFYALYTTHLRKIFSSDEPEYIKKYHNNIKTRFTMMDLGHDKIHN